MYTTIKRVLSALLCVVLLCGLIPSSAFAASETELKNLALGASASASDANDAQHIAQYAIDGNPDTYWCGNSAASHWLMVDLGKTAEIDHVRLLGWPGVEKGSFKFELSADGESWSTFATVTSAAPVTSATVTNYPGLEGYFLTAWAVEGSGTGRYLRVTDFVFGDSQTQWPSVFELEVWGTEAKAEDPPLPDNIPVNPETPEVEIWDRTDIVLHSSTDYTEAGYNPYQDVTLDAVFTHEDGTQISIPGFWNGGNEYRVRFSPTKTGTWTYLITSNRRDDLGLFLRGSITAVANTSDTEIGTHGFIRLSDTGRYFTYDDGTPFYWLGDTHWQSMNFESITKCNYPGCTCGNQFLHELKNRKGKGFNVYQTYFSSEDDGKSQPYCTEPGFWLDDQLYSCVDPTTFSEKIDKMFDALAENDMVIALGYGIALFTPQQLGDRNFAALARYLTARYASYPVVWITGQEVDYRTDGDTTFNQWLKIADLVDQLDGYDHPMTAHMWPDAVRTDTKEILNAQAWHDWWAVQGGHDQMPTKALYQKYWNSNKAFLETELFYEDISCGPTAAFNGYEKSRIGAWKANLCGSCGFTYGATGIWSNCYSTAGDTRMLGDYSAEPWYMGLDKPGSYEMTYLKRFFEYVDFTTLIPRFSDTAYSDFTAEDKLVASRSDASTYIAYFYNTGRSTGELRRLDPAKVYTVSWYNPLTGKFVEAGQADVTSDGVCQLPEKPTDGDWALVVTSETLGERKTESAYQDMLAESNRNLALGASVTASSFNEPNTGNYTPDKAVDGRLDTYWCAQGTPVQWLELDLGKTTSFNEIRMLEWPGIQACSYTITISDDGEAWTTLHDAQLESATESVYVTEFPTLAGQRLAEFKVTKEASARYVHLEITAFDTPGWPTMFEFQIYNRQSSSGLEDGKRPSYAGTVQAADVTCVGGAIYDEAGNLTDTKAALTDGDPSTVWTAFAAIATQTILMDLGKSKELTGIMVTLPDGAYLPEYRILASRDCTDWTILADATLRDAQVVTIGDLRILCEELHGEYRYIKLLLLGAPGKSNDQMQISEIELYAIDPTDKTAASAVEALIDAIGEVTLDSKNTIDAARSAYDALTDEQKALVTNYQTLIDAEARYEELVKSVAPILPVIPSKPVQKLDHAAAELPFTDVVKNSWYYEGVKFVYDNGLMNGTSSYTFDPNANTTRGMIVTILARSEGVNTSNGAVWYAAGREWAMQNGVSDGTNMDSRITREQLAAMLYRFAKLKNCDASAAASLSGFTDASSVSGWALDAMQWAVGAGLVNGRSTTLLVPQGSATRAEVASILMRFMLKYAI